MKISFRLGLGLLLAALLAGCGGTPAPTPASTPSPSAAPSQLPTPTQAVTTAISTPLQVVSVTTTPSPPPTPAVIAPASQPTITTAPAATALPDTTLLVTNSAGKHLSFVDPAKGVTAQVEAGASPWGLAVAPGNRVYVATAEGVAVIDSKERKRLALLPYRAKIGSVQYGEYRPGGMGIAVSPDGKQVYVGIYLSGQASQLEIFDTEKQASVAAVPVGIRPFQVLVSRDGREVYSIDHDSFTVTVVDPVKLSSRTLKIAPFGSGSFDKPHYAALLPDGQLLFPVQGRGLAKLDPATGKVTTISIKTNTHQHGVVLSADGKKLYVVGTGAAGEVSGGPNLAIYDLVSGAEEIIPLNRPHEMVALSKDGEQAYLTGGYTFADGGWDGLTIIDLKSRTIRELSVPGRPLDIARL